MAMTTRKLIGLTMTTLMSLGFGIFGICVLFGLVEVSLQTAAGVAFLAFSMALAADVRLDLRPLTDEIGNKRHAHRTDHQGRRFCDPK